MDLSVKIYLDGEFKDELNGDMAIVSMDNRVMACGIIDKDSIPKHAANTLASMYSIMFNEDNSELISFLSEVCYNTYNMLHNKTITDVYQTIKQGDVEYQIDTENYLKQLWENYLKDLFDKLNGGSDGN